LSVFCIMKSFLHYLLENRQKKTVDRYIFSRGDDLDLAPRFVIQLRARSPPTRVHAVARALALVLQLAVALALAVEARHLTPIGFVSAPRALLDTRLLLVGLLVALPSYVLPYALQLEVVR